MKSEEIFAGFSVGAGHDRFGESTLLGDEPVDCKVSSQDTAGALCILEFTGSGGGPLHRHREQDEWIYVVEGECHFQVGAEVLRLTAGDGAVAPREVAPFVRGPRRCCPPHASGHPVTPPDGPRPFGGETS